MTKYGVDMINKDFFLETLKLQVCFLVQGVLYSNYCYTKLYKVEIKMCYF